MRDAYKFPTALRCTMRQTATLLTNLAHDKLRELDEDDQAAMRAALDTLDRLCTETGLAARSAVPAQAGAADLPSAADVDAAIKRSHEGKVMWFPVGMRDIEQVLAAVTELRAAAQPQAQGEHSAGVGDNYQRGLHDGWKLGLRADHQGYASATAQGDGERAADTQRLDFLITTDGFLEQSGNTSAERATGRWNMYRYTSEDWSNEILPGMDLNGYDTARAAIDAAMAIAAAHKAQQERGQ